MSNLELYIDIEQPVSLDLDVKQDLYLDIDFDYTYSSDLTQYNYYGGGFVNYSGLGVAEVNYDGVTYVRKVIESGAYKKQISTDGITWSDLSPKYTISGTQVRNGVLTGYWYVDYYNGSSWIHVEGPVGTSGGLGYFRDGVRDAAYVLDETLTATGFSGVEGIDWKNIYKSY